MSSKHHTAELLAARYYYYMMTHLTLIAVAGALGTLARYGTSIVAATFVTSGYPLGTFIVNIVGCFLFGAFAGLFGNVSTEWKAIVLTGFLGGFTTFSAFAFENYQFLERQQYVLFAIHMVGQNVLGITAVLLGLLTSSGWR
jgi:CrcB protein